MRSDGAFEALAAALLLGGLLGCTVPAEEAAGGRALIVAGGTLLTMDDQRTIVENGAVAIAGSSIVAVGTDRDVRATYPEATVLDATGKLVLPGLINAHAHVPMTLLRGIADDLPLTEWLTDVIFPAEAEFVDEEFVRWGTRLACLEMIRGGITTFVDMYYYEDAIAEETDRCGMRAVLGETLIDFPAPDNATWDEAVTYTERFVNRWRDHPRISPAVAPHAPYTVSGDHLVAGHRLATELDVPLLIHLAEDKSEVETILEKHGMRPVQYADSLGILDDRVLAAHMIHPSTDEIGILAARGVGVAHCPESNMKVAAGVAPVPQLLAAGVAVGLGTDGAASNNNLSVWDEMDTAAKLHKVTTGDPTALDAQTALALATRGGARALDMVDQIGSLEPGKRADLIIVNIDGYHQQPVYDPYSVLVYSTQASDVETVIIDGRVVMKSGTVLTLDADEVLTRAQEYRDRIRAGITHPQ
ncbi:MAG: amidohydrolase [Acidobacteriota bacterium]|nr:amidohydrolase [Acidobacteriota bacterium]